VLIYILLGVRFGQVLQKHAAKDYRWLLLNLLSLSHMIAPRRFFPSVNASPLAFEAVAAVGSATLAAAGTVADAKRDQSGSSRRLEAAVERRLLDRMATTGLTEAGKSYVIKYV